MSEKRYYWMRLKEDFFTSKRIKRLRSLAGGDTYTIIYLKMQLNALKTDGYLYFDGVMDTFAEELALDIDENPDDVKITINYLLSVGLLETNDETTYKLTFLPNLIGSESAHTQRQRDYRRRQKEKEASLCDANVTQKLLVGDVEKEIEIDIEKDIEPLSIISPLTKNDNTRPRKQKANKQPPTLDDVIAYARSRNSPVDPKRFYDYYAEGDWMDGKGNPVRNWKQKLITWEKNAGGVDDARRDRGTKGNTGGIKRDWGIRSVPIDSD